MKHSVWGAFGLSLILLAGCTAAPEAEPQDSPPDGTEWTEMSCRIVDGAESGSLLLAEGEDGPYQGAGIYTLSVGDIPVTVDGAEAGAADLQDGMLVRVRWNGAVAERYPCQLEQVDSLAAESAEIDDRCGLYLQVLSDLWETDSGLNTGLEELGVDFSGLTDLSESERAALTWAFGSAHGLTPVTGTWEQLVEEGYIDGENLNWEQGCLFTLSGSAETGFDAEKWASGLGAYFFVDCIARQERDGTWSYTVGSQAIA